MNATSTRPSAAGIHPLHGLLLSGSFPLFLGAALSDYAYATSYLVQWSTFASWLIAGALLGGGLALSLFVGFAMRDPGAEIAPGAAAARWWPWWRGLLRFAVPLFLIFVLCFALPETWAAGVAFFSPPGG